MAHIATPHPSVTIEAGHVQLSNLGDGSPLYFTPAAALELAARLKSAATSIQQQAVKAAAERLLAAAPMTVWAQATCRRCGAELVARGETAAEARNELAMRFQDHECDGWRAHP